MADPRRQPIVRELEQDGWRFTLNRKNHLKGDHPHATRPIYLPGTPGSHRNDARIRTLAARALRKDENA